jgi:hypothetical protein
MLLHREDALCSYISLTLNENQFAVGNDGMTFHWRSADHVSASGGLRTVSGWIVTLIRTGTTPSIHVDWAETVDPGIQERLKTLIGHCFMERIVLITPWRVLYPDTL